MSELSAKEKILKANLAIFAISHPDSVEFAKLDKVQGLYSFWKYSLFKIIKII